MNAQIFTGPKNYDLLKWYDPTGNDLIIGADQGALFLAEHEIRFNLAVGDFDSVTTAELKTIRQYAEEVLVVPIEKDVTDTHLALTEAFRRGATDVTIVGGIGKRFDHSLATLSLLRLGSVTVVTEHERMYLLYPGTHRVANDHKYISFFAIEDVTNLTLDGFYYPLEGIDLAIGDPLCISNQGHGTVAFDEGLLLVIHQNE